MGPIHKTIGQCRWRAPTILKLTARTFMALTREKQPTEANLTPRIMRNVGTYLTQARLEARDGSFDSNLFLGVLLQYVAALARHRLKLYLFFTSHSCTRKHVAPQSTCSTTRSQTTQRKSAVYCRCVQANVFFNIHARQVGIQMRKISKRHCRLPEPRTQLSQHRACWVIGMMRSVRQSMLRS